MKFSPDMLGRKMRPGQQNDPRILVDPDDAWLLEWKWTLMQRGRYAHRPILVAGERQWIRLHHAILGAPGDHWVDHINGNGLDNRRCNLRLATPKQNAANRRLSVNNTSGRKGVDFHLSRWRARIRHNGRLLYLGHYADPDEAACAYDKAASALRGEYALTNEMLGW